VFSLDKEQQEKLDNWINKQYPDGLPYSGAIGGQFTYCFTNTGLGQIIVVKDNISGKEINLTDFDNW
jgi:hypothetical protein